LLPSERTLSTPTFSDCSAAAQLTCPMARCLSSVHSTSRYFIETAEWTWLAFGMDALPSIYPIQVLYFKEIRVYTKIRAYLPLQPCFKLKTCFFRHGMSTVEVLPTDYNCLNVYHTERPPLFATRRSGRKASCGSFATAETCWKD